MSDLILKEIQEEQTPEGVTFYLTTPQILNVPWEYNPSLVEFTKVPIIFCHMYICAKDKKKLFPFDIIPVKDIHLVMKQSNVDFETARKALVAKQGDIVNAICHFY